MSSFKLLDRLTVGVDPAPKIEVSLDFERPREAPGGPRSPLEASGGLLEASRGPLGLGKSGTRSDLSEGKPLFVHLE